MNMKGLLRRLETPLSEKGFTLIEVLVAIAIAGIVMAGIYSAYYSQQKSYVVQEQVAEAQQNLRAAMNFIEREIRMAGCDPMGSADAAIITAGANSIQFSEDISDGAGGSSNGVIDTDSENITYYLEDGKLRRSTIDGATGNPIVHTLAENIQGLNFTYFDADTNEIAQPITSATIVNIRSVRVGMTAPAGTNQRAVTAHVKCRNLGLD